MDRLVFINEFLKSVSSERLFMFARILVGQYQNITSSKWLSYLFRIYSVTVVTVVIYAHLFLGSAVSFYLSFCLVMEYLIEALLFQCVSEDYFVKYYSALKSSDGRMGPELTSLFSRSTFIVFSIMLCSKIYLQVTHFLFLKFDLVYVATSVLMMSVDLSYLLKITLLDLHYGRMKFLRRSFEGEFLNLMVIGAERVNRKIENIKKRLLIYDNLVDNLLVAYKYMHYLLGISFVRDFVLTIQFVHTIITGYVTGQMSMWTLLAFLFHVIYMFLGTVCVPALFVELASCEADRFRRFLAKQYAKCSAESLRAETQYALVYLRRRPVRLRICRAVRIDATLPLTMLGLCTSYTIVMIQFCNFK